MEKVILFGNQSVAKEVFHCLKYYSDYEVAGFVVDKEYVDKDHLLGLPLFPFEGAQNVFPPDTYKMFIAIGYVQNNKLRADRYLQAKKLGYKLINFISPRSIIFPESVVGENCFIGHFTSISPNAKIGNDVVIGNGCDIAHDVIISDHCFISSNVTISGGVNIGSYCYFATGSKIRNKINIGKECVIGAGATLLENAEDKSVYLGEPATLLPISSDKLPLG